MEVCRDDICIYSTGTTISAVVLLFVVFVLLVLLAVLVQKVLLVLLVKLPWLADQLRSVEGFEGSRGEIQGHGLIFRKLMHQASFRSIFLFPMRDLNLVCEGQGFKTSTVCVCAAESIAVDERCSMF